MNHPSLLDQLPSSLWAKSLAIIGGTHSAYIARLTCSNHNPGITVLLPDSLSSLAHGSHTASPSQGCQYSLVVVCMFCDWTYTSPVDRPLLLLWLKVCEKGCPYLETPLNLHNNWGTCFICQVFRQICAIWLVLPHLPCAHHPQSSELVTLADGIMMSQWANL